MNKLSETKGFYLQITLKTLNEILKDKSMTINTGQNGDFVFVEIRNKNEEKPYLYIEKRIHEDVTEAYSEAFQIVINFVFSQFVKSYYEAQAV